MRYRLGAHTPQLLGEGHFIAPTADVIGDVILHERVSIWFGAVLRGDSATLTIGPGSNVQDLSVVHADAGVPATIGAGVTIGHKACIHGCTIGDNSLIGIGAIVLNRAVIGPDSIVGAGALVPEGKTYPPRSLLIGVPARVARSLSDDEVAALRESASHYQDNGARFQRELAALD